MAIEGNLQVFRFCRIPFGVVSSPFLLGATIAHHLKQSDNSLATSILRNTYVDNVVTGVQNVAETKKLYIESKELFAKASMNLREWDSNSKEFFKFIAEEDKAPGVVCKVLGIVWNTENDTITMPACSKDKQSKVSTNSSDSINF